MEWTDHHLECGCDWCIEASFVETHMHLTNLIGMQALALGNHYVKYCIKHLMRDSEFSGYRWVLELWHGHDFCFFQMMRMRKPMLRELIVKLAEVGGLQNPKRVTLEESMAIFLLIVGQGLTYPAVVERMQRSTETISNHFHRILTVLCYFGKSVVRPMEHNFTCAPDHIRNNDKYWPYFKDCIGAIDGTHIGVHVADEIKVPWVNRKGITTTNVLAICDFNMFITFTAVGMEGSMHDSRVLSESMRNPLRHFFKPPEGKYYLADAGYPLMRGFLTPYKRTRYHLSEFRRNRNMLNPSEKVNYRHSSLRSIIERTFGVLKKRWRVLQNMPIMDISTQIKIIYACITLHNFIRRYDSSDIELLGDIPAFDENLSSRLRNPTQEEWIMPREEEIKFMEAFQNRIRDSI